MFLNAQKMPILGVYLSMGSVLDYEHSFGPNEIAKVSHLVVGDLVYGSRCATGLACQFF